MIYPQRYFGLIACEYKPRYIEFLSALTNTAGSCLPRELNSINRLLGLVRSSILREGNKKASGNRVASLVCAELSVRTASKSGR